MNMNKTILITGTSTGLGRATAKHFQAKGWNVIATMRTPTHETELTQLQRTLVTRLDVQDIPSIQSAVDAGIAKLGTPGEYWSQFDPDEMSRQIVDSTRDDMRDTVDRIMTREHPRLWGDLPPDAYDRAVDLALVSL